jgi:hypothetical protein
MKKFDVARALNILANFGVIVGLIFVGIELQQNTRVIDRDFQISQLDYGLGTFVNSDYLPQIVEKINRVEDTSVSGDLDALLMDAFDLTNAEAARWWRWMMSQWLRDEVDWNFAGRGDNCFVGQILRNQNNNHILWDQLKNNGNFDPEYAACVDGG